MKPITVVTSNPHEATLSALMASGLIDQGVFLTEESVHFNIPNGFVQVVAQPLFSYKTLHSILKRLQTEYLLLIVEPHPLAFEPRALERLLEAAKLTKAGMVYSDFYDQGQNTKKLHPLNAYQPGSVRDDFNFGPMFLFSAHAVQKALNQFGPIPEVHWAGLYDLRLKISMDHAVHHLAEPIYSIMKTHESTGNEKVFNYLDPKNRAAQKEMEAVFTDYLKRINAYLPPPLNRVEHSPEPFPVEASVIVPVRNRKETVGEALRSALSQKTNFSFNVVVVDNHSTDGTTDLLSNLARTHHQIKLIIPEKKDLGIGGCWNEAIHHQSCGRYAIQLDSDDLYSSPHTLQKMVDMLRQGKFAMVIGSYTVVDFNLREIPPGLIDHREWTDDNGHNNALRINGLGAPRAFNTELIRKIGFLNVSYGEDYAAALRICREYQVGRIYESLYLCRRWSGNTDARLTPEEENLKNAFKDKIRTEEILTRQKMVKERNTESLSQ